MNEWIIRALFAAAGAAAYKIAEVAIKRLRERTTMTPLEMRDALVELVKEQESPPQEAPVEVETTAKA